MIDRKIEQQIKDNFFGGKIIMVVGTRQIGKTTLVENILETTYNETDIIRFNGDYIEDRELLNQNSLKKYKYLKN